MLKRAASTESRIVCGLVLPGIGITTGDCASSQASVSRCGLTSRMIARTSKSSAPCSGDHGR